MAKLRNSFPGQKINKIPVLGGNNSSTAKSGKVVASRDLAARLLGPTGVAPSSSPLNFGTPHTKATPAVPASSGFQWMDLLHVASGGVSSVLGGGILSSNGFNFITKLFSLFGGAKSVPAAPVAFVSPIQKHASLNVTVPSASGSVSLGVHPLSAGNQSSGIYQHSGSSVDQHSQSAQVVQIVKQALLTSSALNDVISEI